MNQQPNPGRPDRSDPADDRLRAQMRSLQAPTDEVDAVGDRVFAQWRERHRPAAIAPRYLGGAAGAASILGLRASRHRWWVGLTTGLLACVVIATAIWVQRPDPILEELMQPDVLSQMAIGEM